MQTIYTDVQCLKNFPFTIQNGKKTHYTLKKNYDKNIDKGHIFEVDIEYPKNLHDLHNDLSFLPEIMKLKKCNKLVCNLYDVYKRALQQTLNNGLVLKKAHTITKFKQKA